jgi:hypothetical protein
MTMHEEMDVVQSPSAAPPWPGRDPSMLVGAAASAGGAILAVLAYLASLGAALRPLGPDLFGYIWQTRLVGHVPLSSLEPRPGIPVLGATLAGLGVTSDRAAALVLSLVTIIALGFAVAVTLRLAFGLPMWALGALGFVVALWGGSVHLSQGHLANLLSLVCIVPAVVFLTLPGGSWGGRVGTAFAATTASGLAHAGFLPFYAAVAVGWMLLSIPSLSRARRDGARWWEAPSCSFTIAVGVAMTIVAIVIFGVLGETLEGFTNIDDGVAEYAIRLSEITSRVGLWISGTSVLALLGVAVAWRLRGPRSLPLVRLGAAWMALSALGGLAAALSSSFPGHRALAIAFPIAALVGLATVGIATGADEALGAGVLGARPAGRPIRAAIVALIVVACCALVVVPGLTTLRARARQDPRGELDRAIASYVAGLDAGRTVVVVVEPVRELAALSWRGRQNQIRALVPRASIHDIYVLIGRLGPDLVPEPAPASGADAEAIAYAVRQSWAAGGAALREGAVVLALKAYTSESVWDRLSADRDRIVLPKVAVVRGPRTPHEVLVPRADLPLARAAREVVTGLLALTLLGAGFGVAAARTRGGTVLDALALAPALGTVLAVLVGVGVATLGGDPAGLAGLLLLGSCAVGGYVIAWRRRPPAGGGMEGPDHLAGTRTVAAAEHGSSPRVAPHP